MSDAVQPTGDQSGFVSSAAELPTWVTPVQYLLTGFRWVESFILLLIFVALFGASSPQFRSSEMVKSIATISAPLILFALGMMLTMLIGGIDFSVGGVAALSSMVAVTLITNNQWSAGSTLWIALLIGLLFGLINGAITVIFRVPAFVITLAIGAFARGLAASISDGRSIVLKDNGFDFLSGSGNSVPASFFISLAIALLIWVILLLIWVLRTRTSLNTFIMKGVQKRLSKEGIVVTLLLILTFAVSGALAAFSGILTTANLRVAFPTTGTGQEVVVLAAVVIGSVSLLGGMGNAISIVAGVLAMVILQSGLVLLNVSAFNTTWIIAFILIIAAAINTPLNLLERWLKQRRSIARQIQSAGQ